MTKIRSFLTYTLLLAFTLQLAGQNCSVHAQQAGWTVPLTSAPMNLSGNSAGKLFQLEAEASDSVGLGNGNFVPLNLSGNAVMPMNLSGYSIEKLFHLERETSVNRVNGNRQNSVPMNRLGNAASPLNLSGNSAGNLSQLEAETSKSVGLGDGDLRNVVPINLSGNVVSPMNLSGNAVSPMNLSGNVVSPMNLSGNVVSPLNLSGNSKLSQLDVEAAPSLGNGDLRNPLPMN